MDNIINVDLLRNPMNWITVGGMIVMVWLAVIVVWSHAKSGSPS